MIAFVGTTGGESGFGGIVREATRLSDLSTTGVFLLLEDREGQLWLGTRVGLLLSDGKPNRFDRRAGERDQSLPNMETAIREEEDGGMLVGMLEGIAGVSGGLLVDEPVFAGQNMRHINFIRRDRQGNSWNGSNRRLWRVRAGAREVERLSNAPVHAIVEGQDGRIWFAVRKAEGLEHNTVYWLMEDDEGWSWMATPVGMLRVRTDAVADSLPRRGES